MMTILSNPLMDGRICERVKTGELMQIIRMSQKAVVFLDSFIGIGCLGKN